MNTIKQSLCLGCFQRGGLSLEELIAGAAEIGYAAVELWGRDGVPFDDIVKLTQKHGLKIASMSGHGSLPDGLNKPANHDRIEAELKESIAIAADLGIPGLICFSGNRDGLDDYTGLINCAEGLKRSVELAEAKGVNLNVELLNSKVDHPDYQCDKPLWGVTLCKLVGSPRAKLLYDIYHMQIMVGDLIRDITTWHEHIGHFHTAGNPGRHDLDDEQEIHYPAVMRAIAATGYEWYVGHEYSPKQADTKEAVLASLKQAFEACNQSA